MKTNRREFLAKKIEDFVVKTDYVSLMEIKKLINSECGEGAAEGDYRISLPDLNVVIGVGLSGLLTDVMCLLQDRQNIEPEPCSPLVYFVDGCVIPTDIELAKRIPKDGYKEPRWCPVVWRKKKEE